MADIGEIKARMVSVGETKKITDAMYMISSVKLRKAKKEVLNTEPYFSALKEQISELLKYIPEVKNRYFHTNIPDGLTHGRHGILLVTSDKGLAGSYNQSAIHVCEEIMSRHSEVKLFIVGEYGRQYFKNKKIPFEEDFGYSAAFPSVYEAQKICVELLEYFDRGDLEEINIIYTRHKGVNVTECRRNILLPLDRSIFKGAKTSGAEFDNLTREFYPDAETLLDEIVPSYLTGFIYSSLVDSYCSEQESRMTAMSTAGKNAEEMLKKLKTQYNSIRQAAITNEMIEITSGAKALKAKRVKKNVQH